jgi:hypothetical protein
MVAVYLTQGQLRRVYQSTTETKFLVKGHQRSRYSFFRFPNQTLARYRLKSTRSTAALSASTMHVRTLLVTFSILSTIAQASGWAVGLWGKNSDFQDSGWQHGCWNLSPGFKAGQATFDGHSCCWADGNELVLYSEAGCNTNYRCFDMEPRKNIVQPDRTKGCTVRSYRIL